MGRRRRGGGPDGVLLLDKPGRRDGRTGPTSHDVVDLVRRALGTRRVGHAGTLDPMASGLLVVLVGRATRLAPYLTAADKVYETELRLGEATDTLDADGQVVARAPVPPLRREALLELLARFEGCIEQRVPAVSAVRVGGERLYERVRRGETVEAPRRQVRVHRLELLGLGERSVRLRVRCGKGFYVRALGRDVAEALGTVGHLVELRRLRSGTFGVEEAVSFELLRAAAEGEAPARAALRAAMLTMAEAAARSLPAVRLQREGAEDARHGRPIALGRIEDEEAPPQGVPLALLAGERLVAVGERRGERLRVLRGFG